ncbi:MAG: hypothetical protein EOO96_17140 [Pedobacter sp.]|nr:MAG: hypothetical protein EOO96_17140 [Pedobacter sp.]
MDNVNLKAAILAVILLIFTYTFYVREPGSVLSVWVPIIFGVIAIVMLVVYFFSIKLIGQAITTKVYPNLGLRILLPFITLIAIAWLIYAFIYVKPFGNNIDFLNVVKMFATKHALFIGICTIIIGLTFSYPTSKIIAVDSQIILKKNLFFLALNVEILLICIFLFFICFKIKQPSLDAKYLQYKSLDESQSSENFEINQLISADEYNYLEKPYFLPSKNEIIIISHYGSNNKLKPVRTIYRLNINGDIIETVDDRTDLRSGDLYPMVAVDGILFDEDKRKEVITWIFDGNKNRHSKDSLIKKKDWILDTLQEETSSLKAVHFQKIRKFHCNDIEDVKYNGDRYYELKLKNDLLKFRIDSIYSHSDNIENCTEKKLDYYTSEKLQK